MSASLDYVRVSYTFYASLTSCIACAGAKLEMKRAKKSMEMESIVFESFVVIVP